MVGKIIRSPQARRDLIHVWRYIAADNERAADQLLDRVNDVLFMLSKSPKAGRARPELGENIRSFPVASYILFYRTGGDGIEIIQFLSARLDIDPDDML